MDELPAAVAGTPFAPSLVMRLLTLSVLMLVVYSVPASAQARVADQGMWAVGADAGVLISKEDIYDNALDLQGFAEYYLTPRVGIRMGAGWANPSVGQGDGDSVRQTRVTFDVTYNWEGGEMHPFVGLGLGAFFLQRRVNDESVGDSQNEAGMNLFGGVEFFTRRTLTVKGEARYQVVGSNVLPDAHGLTLSIGLKKYF
jgi:opacity protein-like surface antigen